MCNTHTSIIYPIINMKHIYRPKFLFVFCNKMINIYRYENYMCCDITLYIFLQHITLYY